MGSHPYKPAWWLVNPHLATIWGRVGRREPPLDARMERLETPDGDFVEIARIDGSAPSSPRILLLHGLEGGTRSHYARAVFREARTRGWGADLLLYRGCGSEPNRLPRTYHSGETGDPRFVLDHLSREFPQSMIGLVGVSLGGNVLCKLLGEAGERIGERVVGAVAISVPFDLARASRHLGKGFGVVYERNFLRSLIPKALGKIARHPELHELVGVRHARTIWEFDDTFTAPLHGFADASDYYQRASAIGFLPEIRLPTLLLSAADDPFLPREVLDDVRIIAARNPYLTVEFHESGGHVGFTTGAVPWNPRYYGEARAAEFLANCFVVNNSRVVASTTSINHA